MIAPGSRYVALGSSMAAGPGISPVIDYGALRSGRNYPHQVAAALHLDLTDVTCSGATTAHVLSQQQRTLTGSRQPQVDAITPDTALVTITIGGNDVGYIGKLTVGGALNTVARALGVASKRSADSVRDLVAYDVDDEQWSTLQADMRDVVATVRQRAPEAHIMLVDYLTVFGADWRSGRQLPLTEAVVCTAQEIAARLAEVTAATAAEAGAELVVSSTPSWEHGIGSAEPWITDFEFGPVPLHGRIPYHPTLAGMTAVAELIVSQLGVAR